MIAKRQNSVFFFWQKQVNVIKYDMIKCFFLKKAERSLEG